MVIRLVIALTTLGVLPASWLADQAGGGLDVNTALLAYGVAAPFALLCFWQMNRTQAKLDAALTRIDTLQTEATKRATDDATRLATLLYDGARLYRQGNESLAQRLDAAPDVVSLMSEVKTLVDKLEAGGSPTTSGEQRR